MRVLPPLFNRLHPMGASTAGILTAPYGPLQAPHSECARICLATLFLADPAEYDGGELVIGEGEDEKWVKLPAGDMVLYSGGYCSPASCRLHEAYDWPAFFWVQEHGQRPYPPSDSFRFRQRPAGAWAVPAPITTPAYAWRGSITICSANGLIPSRSLILASRK